MYDHSMLDLVLMASPLVQAVMAILVFMSVSAWAVALAKSYQIRQAKRQADLFLEEFWESEDLSRLYKDLSMNESGDNQGLKAIFEAGFQEFVRLKNQGVQEANDLVSASHRAMKVVFSKESERLENRLPYLATVGSSAPYIGLFGTVIGVMHAFQGLSENTSATLSAVAPGIAEALLATGIGLFAAIPAVIFYNSLTNKTDKVLSNYEGFADEFLSILQRQAHLANKS
ncbi:protein TolQ [Thiomicrospira microaerophila]|uniref:protein TolQ n=1 Tax=Thiomicrospira microaerophila TaxID=406020 RepID=UPI00200BB092|nr:protein TolQ [Thiomicrospira microaerophila]UQB41464.1 protein TolQ [Thiomicrospira microaerophila]